ncbi:MAG: efflux RND transporter periplasmic adaptor subunit [Aestuariivita sp.]|nr:efflux RND transporter periplasmic adaptor subunit [Aestuariivita sp.]
MSVASAVFSETPPRLAKIVSVVETSGEITRQFFGHIAAKQTVDLAFQVSGQIVNLNAIEGQTLSEGDLIAQLDQEPFELALLKARTEQLQADRTLSRLQRLQGNSVSEVTVNDAQTNAELAAINVINAERSLKQASLVAPFTALVASRLSANFSTINAGTPIVRLHDMSELRIEIDVPEIFFQAAGENPEVDLTAKFPAIDKEFSIVPREFNAEVSSTGQTFQITLGMPPPEGHIILPGSSVTVTAILKGGTPKLIIPTSSIISTNAGSPQVMIFDATGSDKGKVRKVDVNITPSRFGKVQVLSGLIAGQEIIASGAALLADGEIVRRFSGFSN